MNFETSNITTQDYFKFFICLFLIFCFALFLYFNPNIFESKYYIYILFILIFCAVSFGASIYLSKSKSKSTIMFVLLGFMMLFIFYYYAYKFFQNLDLVNSGMYIVISQVLLIIAIIFGLSIFSTYLVRKYEECLDYGVCC